MALNKKAEFPARAVELSVWAKALAHPARIEILRTVAAQGSCICGEVVEVMPLAQSTVSQHLRELKEAGLITGEVDGLKSCYCVNVEGLAAFRESMTAFLDDLEKKMKACC